MARLLHGRGPSAMSPGHPLRPSLVGAVAVGGALGAVLRYALTVAFPDPSDGFPWTIFAVNVLGCALLAPLPAIPVLRLHPALPPLLGPGVLGGFTTLSTFAEQARALVAARPRRHGLRLRRRHPGGRPARGRARGPAQHGRRPRRASEARRATGELAARRARGGRRRAAAVRRGEPARRRACPAARSWSTGPARCCSAGSPVSADRRRPRPARHRLLRRADDVLLLRRADPRPGPRVWER